MASIDEIVASGESNLVYPHSQKGTVVAVTVLTTTLPTGFVWARIYTRRFIDRKIWLDDCSSVFFVIPVVPCTVVVTGEDLGTYILG